MENIELTSNEINYVSGSFSSCSTAYQANFDACIYACNEGNTLCPIDKTCEEYAAELEKGCNQRRIIIYALIPVAFIGLIYAPLAVGFTIVVANKIISCQRKTAPHA